MSPNNDTRIETARCALCGGRAPRVVEGVRWDICPACAAGLPETWRRNLDTLRHVVRVAARAGIALAWALGALITALLLTTGVTLLVLACIALSAGVFGLLFDRAKQRLRDAVHVVALNAITSRAPPPG
ncbi:MAG: hypothetical protein Q6373_008050 [Candidatus Sigynarchaeota archaeon]